MCQSFPQPVVDFSLSITVSPFPRHVAELASLRINCAYNDTAVIATLSLRCVYCYTYYIYIFIYVSLLLERSNEDCDH